MIVQIKCQHCKEPATCADEASDMMPIFFCDHHCAHDEGCQKPVEPDEVVALRTELAALKSARWAGPWQPVQDEPAFERLMPHGTDIAVVISGSDGVCWMYRDANDFYNYARADGEKTARDATSIEAAKSAADEALRAAGWFLSDETSASRLPAKGGDK